MEIWKDIPNTNGKLQVSSHGRVRSYLRDKDEGAILKTCADKKGYLRLRVTLEREKRCYKVHRLVADAFLDNPDGKTQVNHIDGDKTNNFVGNLEWATNAENAHHAIDAGLWGNVFCASARTNEARKLPIVAINAETGEQMLFDSVAAAERHFNSRHISDVLNGKRSKAAGHYFRKRVV